MTKNLALITSQPWTYRGTTTISAAMDDKVITDKIWSAIDATNKNGDIVISMPQKFKIYYLTRDFSVETGEITPTFKTKEVSFIINMKRWLIKFMRPVNEKYVKYENA